MADKTIQEVKASLRFLRQGPRKVGLLVDVIRGMDVIRARAELLHIPKRASGPMLKLLDSAIANAKNNFHLQEDSLYVKVVRVDQGPTLKRFMPRAHGRASQILRRSSHVLLILGVKEKKTVDTQDKRHKEKADKGQRKEKKAKV